MRAVLSGMTCPSVQQTFNLATLVGIGFVELVPTGTAHHDEIDGIAQALKATCEECGVEVTSVRAPARWDEKDRAVIAAADPSGQVHKFNDGGRLGCFGDSPALSLSGKLDVPLVITGGIARNIDFPRVFQDKSLRVINGDGTSEPRAVDDKGAGPTEMQLAVNMVKRLGRFSLGSRYEAALGVSLANSALETKLDLTNKVSMNRWLYDNTCHLPQHLVLGAVYLPLLLDPLPTLNFLRDWEIASSRTLDVVIEAPFIQATLVQRMDNFISGRPVCVRSEKHVSRILAIHETIEDLNQRQSI